MQYFFTLVLFFLLIFFVACDKTKAPATQIVPAKVYNYDTFVFAGYSAAHYTNIADGTTSFWDSVVTHDTLIVKVDSAQDHILFSMNTKNPFGVYPQFEYEFDISSNYFRKNFIQNYYQSFYYEGDTLKSYFYKLQQGGNSSYQKEIKFSGVEVE